MVAVFHPRGIDAISEYFYKDCQDVRGRAGLARDLSLSPAALSLAEKNASLANSAGRYCFWWGCNVTRGMCKTADKPRAFVIRGR